ncbi:glycosyltransferase family 2 protein [Absicoccus intestinalis]|uniref:Glycosyltransferase n=1 Tax=Absicoccus intestinalis TaxID=2926319 RepID=A0ABU4WMQ3_9FIRM|nr:glycosyltransferase family 2 protein [Absicoccus sp. CLA-KB-P134]MDX8417830.1 glycosyltransferase [Absicoccus sp. CLA-KB-P134]
MKVSILITAYNCEQYIDDAIKSVVIQEMPFSWELLVGDDGSSDTTQERINKWINRFPNNIKLYIMQRDKDSKKDGTRAAKNRANLLEKATGEYLIFLDGDDQFIGTQKIKKQVELLDDKKYIECSCVAHNIMANDINNAKKYPLVDTFLHEGIIDSKYYWEKLYFHTNTILFRSCCKELMLNPKYRNFLNDNFITYIILQYGKIYYINKLWAQYNLTGDGLWTGKKRTYGCFRNLIIFDLQLDIDKSFEKSCFIRHLYDFKYIFENYKKEDQPYIEPLIKNLDKKTFHYTFLMYHFYQDLDKNDRIEKKKLQFKITILQIYYNVSVHLDKLIVHMKKIK